jgi:ubiquinone/menaquinone biosynthesis C-methylase UbiE
VPIDFHAAQNRYTYASREADPAWRQAISKIVAVNGKNALDIGGGGGIYIKALAQMGATHVTGVDFSREMLLGAQEYCQGYDNITFKVGSALATGLPDEQYDFVLERALTHHLKPEELPTCFAEARRLLRSGGVFIVQNRTPQDCSLPGDTTHLRGYYFERYPRLLTREIARRPDSATMFAALQQAGFHTIEERKLWETVKVYPDITALANELLARTGRSILHELSDDELCSLVDYIRERFTNYDQQIVEQGRWTLWIAHKD